MNEFIRVWTEVVWEWCDCQAVGETIFLVNVAMSVGAPQGRGEET